MRTRNPHRLRELMLERVDRVDRENQRRDAAITARQEAKLREAVKVLKNPASGVTLVSHGWSEPSEPVTDYEMANAMMTYGGKFATALGCAWQCADEINRAKILAAFPELVSEYRELARLKREQHVKP